MPNEIERARRNDMVEISRAELERLIDSHCDERLSQFGIDWESADGVREFISDQIFLRRLRKTSERAHHVGLFAMITAAISGIAAMVWAYWKR